MSRIGNAKSRFELKEKKRRTRSDRNGVIKRRARHGVAAIAHNSLDGKYRTIDGERTRRANYKVDDYPVAAIVTRVTYGATIPCGIVAPQSGAKRREPAAFVAFAEGDTQLSDISCLHWQSVTILPSLYRREYGYLGRRVRGGF